jgi:hypothetical protein
MQAMALILALTVAPMALFAAAWKCACASDYCTMACCRHGKCLMMQHEHRQGSSPSVQCNCMRFPVFGTLAPLTEMILARPAPMPGIVRMASDATDVPMAILPGFLPSPFHPPRG